MPGVLRVEGLRSRNEPKKWPPDGETHFRLYLEPGGVRLKSGLVPSEQTPHT